MQTDREREIALEIRREWGGRTHDRRGEIAYVPSVTDGGLTAQLIDLAVARAYAAGLADGKEER